MYMANTVTELISMCLLMDLIDWDDLDIITIHALFCVVCVMK